MGISCFDQENFLNDDKSPWPLFNNVAKIGIWLYNSLNHQVKWSTGFYLLLGYQRGEIPCSSDFFLDNLLYHKDKPVFLSTINENWDEASKTIEIRILTKTTGYKWFEHTVQKKEHKTGSFFSGLFFDIDQQKRLSLLNKMHNQLHSERLIMSKTSTWEIDVKSSSASLSADAFTLLEIINPAPISIEEIISFAEADFHELLKTAIDDIIHFCKPFELEILIRTVKRKPVWVFVKAIPVIDHFGNCVTVQGIFQQINKYKKRENDIQRSVALLSDQNKRLQNYADMVSHNLRSHTGNLEALVALYEQAQDTDDRGEIFAHVKMISSSLSNTIHQLNEVVKIQAETRTQRKTVSFEKVFKNILAALDSNIKSVDATINFDFSRCPEISYIPAYLESIFQNLLTNSLKYRHPDRKPVIKTYTYQTDDHAYLFFEDNGLGFDVAKYGDNIFGLHKTFHNHPEAKGIGLFITRNQIEALGGSIKLESTINVGTKFSIMLV